MRKIVLFLLLLILSMPVFSQQQVNYIKLTDDRWEFMTKEESFYPKNQKDFRVSFQVYNDINEPNLENRLRFFLILTFDSYDKNTEIPSGGKILLKTGKEEVIASTNEVNGSILAFNPATGDPDHISCHEYVPGRYFSSYKIRGKYELFMEDIIKMMNDGVIKIRVETNGESIDINLPLEETVKVGKEKKNFNKFGFSIGGMLLLADKVFYPLREF